MADRMKDIFSRESSIGDAFSADDTELIFAGGGMQELVIQRVSITYRQNVSRAWEIGSNQQYFIAGHQEGTLTFARVVGPKGMGEGFLTKYGDVCQAAGNQVTFKVKGDCSTVGGEISASGVVIVSVGYTIAAQDMVVNEAIDALVARVEAK
jgi:hypothetical protein